MRFARRVLIGVGIWLTMLHAPSLAGQVAGRTILRSPASGYLADGVPLYSAPAGTSVDVLKDMAARAAVIFVGTVTAVKKPSDTTMQGGAGAAVVEVDFLVDRGVRGAVPGQAYAMREWAGLWRDTPRFVVGERLLMLLHGPGPGGLSSPVDGLDGAIPVRGGGQTAGVPLASTSVKALAVAQTDDVQTGGAASSDAVDMRWLQAKTLRVPAYSDGLTAEPGVSTVGGTASETAVGTTPAVGAAPLSGATTEVAATVDLTSVLGLLASWQGTRSASN